MLENLFFVFSITRADWYITCNLLLIWSRIFWEIYCIIHQFVFNQIRNALSHRNSSLINMKPKLYNFKFQNEARTKFVHQKKKCFIGHELVQVSGVYNFCINLKYGTPGVHFLASWFNKCVIYAHAVGLTKSNWFSYSFFCWNLINFNLNSVRKIFFIG